MKSHKNSIINLIVFAFIFLFLFSFFEPQHLFSLTTPTGGDTASHYPTAVYLKEVLLAQGKIMGWDMGNYAGYPLFYHYFPLTFILMALLSFIIPMQIAFKLISILGIFLLPICIYFTFKTMKYPFPIPIIGSCFSLAFLFMEGNSMWGGNIPSCLAGEYSYSLSLSLMVLFFGTLYTGIKDNNKIIMNAILLFLIGFSHGFTLIFSGIIAVFFLSAKKDFWRNFKYLFKVFGLGTLLLSFWLIPFIANLPWVTSYVTYWPVKFFEVFPLIIIPFAILSILALILNAFDKRTLYFGYVILISIVLYFLSPKIGILNIRFVPFLQLYLSIFGAAIILPFSDKIKAVKMLPVIGFLIIALWIVPNTSYIKGWIKWNYEGFEQKTSWPLFKQINDYLKTNRKGRVVYEHSPAHNTFGSERAFENLPHFAKRETLEGLYMQSSISSPFIFFIQSEISKVSSTPFPNYPYSRLNLPAALPRLKLFNVSQYIARSPEAKKEAKETQGLLLEKTFGDYEIYKLTQNDGRYVVPLKYQPVLFETDHWKQAFHAWFRNLDLTETPLVYIKNPGNEDLRRFKLQSNRLLNIPKAIILKPKAKIKETIKAEEILFSTNLVGYPHLIKVSYHPNWKVEGADKVYLVSPSFMLVYPNQNKVRLYFGKSKFNCLGELASIFGLFIVLISGIIFLKHANFNRSPNL